MSYSVVLRPEYLSTDVTGGTTLRQLRVTLVGDLELISELNHVSDTFFTIMDVMKRVCLASCDTLSSVSGDLQTDLTRGRSMTMPFSTIRLYNSSSSWSDSMSDWLNPMAYPSPTPVVGAQAVNKSILFVLHQQHAADEGWIMIADTTREH